MLFFYWGCAFMVPCIIWGMKDQVSSRKPQFVVASIQVEVLTPMQDCVLCLKQVIFLDPKF